jgi:type I restriction enzyme R subunit
MIQRLVIKTFREDSTIELNADSARRVNGLVVKEYLNEYLGRA